jgi:hypothetical protein
MRPKLTYANVTATLALIIAVGGASAFAASQLAKNSVGAKQLKKNAVTTAKVKNQAVTAAKIKDGTLTGKQINAATLGTVPNAQTAQTAQTANALPPPEAWHEVGTPGEPTFEGIWKNFPEPQPFESVAFYKDYEGVVHLRGQAFGGGESPIFRLPPGFRPAESKQLEFQVGCTGSVVCADGTGALQIHGPGGSIGSGVFAPSGATQAHLSGVTFRAES